ncbi:hypothetical protein H2198_005960 [Neophaeococcomyces mojaviensis]|uniref:Uncharacterized protein n=1 Tax=Neophaeococcomyces mojaviensis TaxID=3383035 RepID=A0ACC3A4N9_9EURO|nr:hypothetical protein H2198_005960 [Knufia sp. JES_112]
MSKLLVIFGATGQQGGSVLDYVLNDAELSSKYVIRAITRDVNSDSAKKISSKGVEVVSADPNDDSTLRPALRGANTVFAMTFPSFADVSNTENIEVRQGKAITDAAVAERVDYLIFSTLPHVSKLSGGKYTKVQGFDGKAIVEQYIRQQQIKSAFFAPGSFMQNFNGIMKPRPVGDGTYSISRHCRSDTPLPLIDTAGDTGKWIGSILADPEKYEGKTFCAATKLYTLGEQAAILSKATGRTVVYKQLPPDVYRSMLPPVYGDILMEMMAYQEDFGYYGADQAEKIAWAAENARGKLTTFEEYLEKNPVHLD